MDNNNKPTVLRLADYKPSAFQTDEVHLNFDIHDDHTLATSKVTYKRSGAGPSDLILNAENPNPETSKDFLQSVKIDGKEAVAGKDYFYDAKEHTLRVPVNGSEVELEIETYLEPQNNSALTGLYKSDGTIVTQCESEGFRRITPFLDRPDVMAKYTVRIEGSEKDHPTLMANGNKIASKSLGNGRHEATFNDPWNKPSYLFCTANTPAGFVAEKFIRKDGVAVENRVYTETGDPELGRFALESLARSEKFDEDVFDCVYDLDNFNIIAVAKFNFGAMENKGLNVFRDSLILASPEIATDGDYRRIDDVVYHEYAHNYSGNRVTVANWFNISLKEGLTVLREQMFTAAMTSPAWQRINAVRKLRASQFPEDDGPLSHPVMPQEVQSVENCYTMTTYEKGAEVLRMMGELMGREKLIEGIKHYFKTYDGQAVTINEFVKSMEFVSGLDLSNQFSLWYTQSGRPRVKAEGVYDASAQTYTLTLEQTVPPTRDQATKQPMYIPVRMGLVDDNGNNMPLMLSGEANPNAVEKERVLHFTQAKQTFTFTGVTSKPAFHSLGRGFSAVVDLDPGLTEDQLYKQLLTDPDGFNRWDAGQKIALAEMKRLYTEYATSGKMPALNARYLGALKTLAADAKSDPAIIAEAIGQPSIKEFEAALKPVSPSAINAVIDHMRESIGKELYSDFEAVFKRTHDGKPYKFEYGEVGKRDMKRVATHYLLANGGANNLALAKALYMKADNMTDKIIAMSNIRNHFSPEREAVFDDFFNKFKSDQLTIQKWFGLQAMTNAPTAIDNVKKIMASKTFNWENPGHIGSLIGGFAGNYQQFHRADGKGYEFIADCVIKLDKINPSTASRIVTSLCSWQNYTGASRDKMIEQLQRIAATPKLSTNVADKVMKALPEDGSKKKAGPAV